MVHVHVSGQSRTGRTEGEGVSVRASSGVWGAMGQTAVFERDSGTHRMLRPVSKGGNRRWEQCGRKRPKLVWMFFRTWQWDKNECFVVACLLTAIFLCLFVLCDICGLTAIILLSYGNFHSTTEKREPKTRAKSTLWQIFCLCSLFPPKLNCFCFLCGNQTSLTISKGIGFCVKSKVTQILDSGWKAIFSLACATHVCNKKIYVHRQWKQQINGPKFLLSEGEERHKNNTKLSWLHLRKDCGDFKKCQKSILSSRSKSQQMSVKQPYPSLENSLIRAFTKGEWCLYLLGKLTKRKISWLQQRGRAGMCLWHAEHLSPSHLTCIPTEKLDFCCRYTKRWVRTQGVSGELSPWHCNSDSAVHFWDTLLAQKSDFRSLADSAT